MAIFTNRYFNFPPFLSSILKLVLLLPLSVCSAKVVFAESSFTEEPILRLETGAHSAPIIRISVDSQEHFLVTGSHDKTARVYDIASGKLLNTLRIPVEGMNIGKIYAVAMSPDGSVVAVAGYTGKKRGRYSIYILNRISGEIEQRISGLANVITHLSYSSDGAYLVASLAGTNGIRLYETGSYQQIAADKAYEGDSYWASFDNNNRLVTSAYDGFIRLYDSNFNLLKRVKTLGGKQPFGIAFSPDDHKIALGYVDSSRVDLLNAKDLKLLFSADTKGVDNGNLGTVAWSTDGHYFYASGTYDANYWNPILRWDKDGSGKRQEFRDSTGVVMDLKPLTGGRLAVGIADSRVALLGKQGQVLWQQLGYKADFHGQRGANGIRLSRNGERVDFGFKQRGKILPRFSVEKSELIVKPVEDQTLFGPVTDSKYLKITDWKDTVSPKLNGKVLKLKDYEMSRSLAIAPKGDRFVLGTEWFLRCFDEKGEEFWQADAPGVAWAVNISGDGKVVVAGFGDGTLRWYRMQDGSHLLTLFAHPDGKRWVLWTPQGYYQASTGGEDLIGWHLNNGADKRPGFFGASRFRAQFYRPDIIARVLDTLDVNTALAQADKARGQKSVNKNIRDILPPVITILAPVAGTTQLGNKLTLTYKAESQSGQILDIEARVDGRPAKVLDHQPSYFENRTTAIGPITVEIPAKNVTVSLIAKNRNGSSETAKYNVNWQGKKDWFKPNLYLLAIGVKEYKEKRYNTLKYPAKDAEDFVRAINKQEGGLYKKVTTKLLTNEGATVDAILDGLEWLELETTSRDVAMVFISGHGIKNPKNNDYLFLAHDSKPTRLNRTAVNEDDIKKFLSAIGGKTVLFLDTCHSGKLMRGKSGLGSQQDTDKLANELAEAETGVIVFASSTGKQLSTEHEKWKNGAFTEALVEGINGGARYDDDWFVSISELEIFVSNRVKELTQGSQTPTTTKPESIQNFNVIKVSGNR